ncbi:hypothetical protein ACJX0J_040119, partial [Zea mays]
GSGTARRLRAATARCRAPTGSTINTMDTLQEAPSAAPSPSPSTPLEATAALYTIQFADPLSSTTQRSTRHHSVCPLLQRGILHQVQSIGL